MTFSATVKLYSNVKIQNFTMFFRSVLESLVSVDSVWSIILRVGIWMLIVVTIIVSVDTVGSSKSTRNLKSNLGLFLMFVVLGFVGLWLLFSWLP